MKFEELDEKHQDFLIHNLLAYLENRANDEGVDNFMEPTHEEYRDFFNEFDEDYEIVDGYPESTVEFRHNKHLISFDDSGKVILESVTEEDDDEEYYNEY